MVITYVTFLTSSSSDLLFTDLPVLVPASGVAVLEGPEQPQLCTLRWPGSRDLTSAISLLLPSAFGSLAGLGQLFLSASPVYLQIRRSMNLLEVFVFLCTPALFS